MHIRDHRHSQTDTYKHQLKLHYISVQIW